LQARERPGDVRPASGCKRTGNGGLAELSTLIHIIYLLVMVYVWLIVAGAVLSWFRLRRGGPVSLIRHVLYAVTEPYPRLFRRLLRVIRVGAVGFDLSAVVGLIVLLVVIQVLARI